MHTDKDVNVSVHRRRLGAVHVPRIQLTCTSGPGLLHLCSQEVGRARGSELNCIRYGGHLACGWLMCGTVPCFHLPMGLTAVIQNNALPNW